MEKHKEAEVNSTAPLHQMIEVYNELARKTNVMTEEILALNQSMRTMTQSIQTIAACHQVQMHQMSRFGAFLEEFSRTTQVKQNGDFRPNSTTLEKLKPAEAPQQKSTLNVGDASIRSPLGITRTPQCDGSNGQEGQGVADGSQTVSATTIRVEDILRGIIDNVAKAETNGIPESSSTPSPPHPQNSTYPSGQYAYFVGYSTQNGQLVPLYAIGQQPMVAHHQCGPTTSTGQAYLPPSMGFYASNPMPYGVNGFPTGGANGIGLSGTNPAGSRVGVAGFDNCSTSNGPSTHDADSKSIASDEAERRKLQELQRLRQQLTALRMEKEEIDEADRHREKTSSIHKQRSSPAARVAGRRRSQRSKASTSSPSPSTSSLLDFDIHRAI